MLIIYKYKKFTLICFYHCLIYNLARVFGQRQNRKQRGVLAILFIYSICGFGNNYHKYQIIMQPVYREKQGSQEQESPTQQNPTNKLIQPKKMFKYEENEFSWGDDGLESSENLEQVTQPIQNVIMMKPKINHLPMVNLKDRKFSCNHAFGSYRKTVTLDQPLNSNEIASKAPQQHSKSPHKQTEDIPEHPLQNHPPEQQPQSYFNKKMRLLEAKFKKCILQYETLLFKARQENKSVSNQLLFYKKYLGEHNPEIKKEIEEIYEEQEDNQDLLSDSSSDEENKESDEITMPVNAQILQIKIEGRKWFEKIRNLEQELKKATEVIKLPDGCNHLTVETADVVRLNQNMRKWSLPRGYDRQKKQSFQTTLISQRSQRDFSEDLTASIQSSVSRDFSNCEDLERSQKLFIQYGK